MLKLLFLYFRIQKNYRKAAREYFKATAKILYEQHKEEKAEKKRGKKDV